MNLCEKCGRPKKFQHHRWCVHSKDEIEEVRKLYDSGLSSLKIVQLGFNKTLVCFSLRGRRRSVSESMKLAHELYVDNFKHSEETKQKLSKIRTNFIKNNLEIGTRWKRQNISYPEKLFKLLIEKNRLFEQYDIVREYCFFPYYLDFAFVNIKLAVEIDGSQHWTIQSKIDRDLKKDEALVSNGWKVYRIPFFLLKEQFGKVEIDFLQYLQTFTNQQKIFKFENEIIEHSEFKKIKEVERQKERQIKKNQKLKIKTELIQQRIKDVNSLNYQKGYISKLSFLWNVSHTQVKRFLLAHNVYR